LRREHASPCLQLHLERFPIAHRRLADRVRADGADPLLRSAYSLMLNVVVATALGVVFWVGAARLYDAEVVGRDAALIAAMMELSVISQLNLVNAVTRFLPNLERNTRRALLGAYALTGGVALVLGAAFVVVAPIASDQFEFFRGEWLMAALYVLAQVLWTWFTLQDAALTALRRAPWVPVENGVFALLKIAALPLLLAVGASHGVFLASVLPVILLLVPVNVFLFRRAIPDHLRRHRSSASLLRRLSRRDLLRFMAQDYGATVLSQATATALPVLVVALIGSSANAYFYIPYTIVVAFTMLFYGACTSLVVEGALAEDRIRPLAARIARLFVVVVVPGTIVMAAAAPLILLPFGEEYAREGAPVLRILAFGGLLRAVSLLYIAIARLQGRGLRILAVDGLQAAILLVGAVVLAKPLGIEGVALAWFAAMAIAALTIVPSLVRFFRSPETGLAPGDRGARASRDEVAHG
jgi:O-antigen/teichoic acid export membrane protein